MKKGGFTLIELLVVISIVALLSSVVLASLNSARDKGRLGGAKYFATQVDHVEGDYMLGGWDFDECSGATAGDRSGNNSGGTLGNSPSWSTDTPSGSGCSMLLNGTNQFVIMGNPSQLNVGTGDLTLSVWFKTTSQASNLWIVDKKTAGTNNAGFDLSTINTLYFRLANGSAQGGVIAASGTNVADGKWHNVVAVANRTDSNLYLYVDGNLNNKNSFTNTWNLSGSDSFTVGAYGGGGGGFFPGNIDGVHVFGKALTARDVGRLYAIESARRNLASR